jgi:hypothetical protein
MIWKGRISLTIRESLIWESLFCEKVRLYALRENFSPGSLISARVI